MIYMEFWVLGAVSSLPNHVRSNVNTSGSLDLRYLHRSNICINKEVLTHDLPLILIIVICNTKNNFFHNFFLLGWIFNQGRGILDSVRLDRFILSFHY